VCDLSLPGLDGLQFMRRTRALPAESGGRVPAIAITAYYEEFVAAAALEAGFDLYMIKPIQLEELCRVAGDLARGGRTEADEPMLGRVLIVEDEREVAAMLHDVLVDLGYHVQEAVSGPAALGLLAVYQPDVVLLDLLLPGMSGEEALEHLQRADAHLPVIVVSASRDPELARRTLACGAFDYVQKPFDLSVLCRSVADALGARRGRS
jgi:CheY-like chemotaxis protein